jgi:hypothetical protein
MLGISWVAEERRTQLQWNLLVAWLHTRKEQICY